MLNDNNIQPCTDVDDERLFYLSKTLVGYLDEWKTPVDNRPGSCSRDKRLKMQLSQQSLDGLTISVRSIVSFIKFLTNQGAPFVLTQRFNQDTLEQHFGYHRHKGGACDNPTIDNVRHTMDVIHVVGSKGQGHMIQSHPTLTATARQEVIEDLRNNILNKPIIIKGSVKGKM